MRELLLVPAIALALTAQTPAFEVASIKPNRAGGGISAIRVTAGWVTMENVSLKKVTLWAYGIPDDREYALIGADWLTSEHFDFQASSPADTPPEQIRAMTQALLAERESVAAAPGGRRRDPGSWLPDDDRAGKGTQPVPVRLVSQPSLQAVPFVLQRFV